MGPLAEEDTKVEEAPNEDTADSLTFTDWEKEPTIKELKQDLEDSRSAHNAHTLKVDHWLENLNVTGAAQVPKRTGRSSIVPKLIRKQAEWRYASLSEPFLSTDDIFNTAPITAEDKAAAYQNGLVLNHQFNTAIQKVKFIDDYVRAAVDEGTVVVRTGWNYQEDVEEIEVPDYGYRPLNNPEALEQFQYFLQMEQQAPEEFAKLPEETLELFEIAKESGGPVEQFALGTTHTEEKITVLANHPTVEVCDYKNLVIDPTCQGDLDKAGFVIYSFETSYAELVRDGKYKNLDKVNFSTASILAEADYEAHDDSSFNFADKPRRKVVAYEYWGSWDIDGTGKLQPIVATWLGNTLIRLERNPYPDQKLPFVTAQYLPVRKSIYGEPDGELLEDNQKIIGAVTRGMIDIMGRSANGQAGSRKDALDVTNKRRFDKGLDYEYNSHIDPRQAFYMHTFPEIPRSAEFILGQQNAEAESLTGIKSFSDGINGKALGVTATGIRSALDATSKRELGILRRLAQGIKDIGRKMVSMNSEFLEEEYIVRITNEEFVPVRRDDLEGNFDLNLTISTAEADNEKASDLSFMLQTMGNNMDPGMTKLILTDIARLRKMPALAKQITDYQPQPDPIAQEKAALEVQLLKAQIFNENMKGEENKRDIALKEAKTATELAKGRNLDSKSDTQDLDFLEKESGLDKQHEIDMKDKDKQDQLDLKAVDSMLAAEDKAKAEGIKPQSSTL